MRFRRAWMGVALVACGGDDAPPADGPAAEPPELAGITQRHNDVRAMVATAEPLPPLVWDAELAATAAAWAAGCRDQQVPTGLIDHNPDRSKSFGYYVGENVFGRSGAPGSGTAQAAVDDWAAERASYDGASHTCQAGATCGHYTQIVWRNTLRVGCAIQDCASLAFRATVVCDYGPGGNVTGEQPY
jgi:hypothetical protein